MLTQIGISLAIFAGVFYLVRSSYPFLEAGLGHWQKKRIDNITPKLDRMFLDVPLRKLLLLDILSPALSGLCGFILTRNLWIGLGAAAGGLLIPIVTVKRLELGRRQRFAHQLVDGLLILSSSLKAGLSLSQSFEQLLEEMPPPISQEFGLVIRQMRMGVSLEEAMGALKRRMRLDELDMVITAMLVARDSGGDLTKTFLRVINTIQERNKLSSRVKALCIQAKLQGAIMSALPVLFAVFVYKMNPDFFAVFFKDNFGRGLLAYVVLSEILGIFFIRKLSRVDI